MQLRIATHTGTSKRLTAGTKRLCLTVAACLFAGCSPQSFEYYSAHLRIASADDSPICQGTLDRLDKHVELIESTLSLPGRNHRTDVFLYSEPPASACGRGISGCYNSVTQEVHTKWSVVEHELVHARTPWAAIPLLDEGNAVDLSRGPQEFGHTSPDELVGKGPRALDYDTAGHFLRWLRLRFGPLLLRLMLEDIDWSSSPYYSRERLAEFTGVSLETLVREYYETAPAIYARIEQPEAQIVVEPGVDFDLDFDLDCEAHDVEGHSGRIWSDRVVEVSDLSAWVVTVTDGSSLLIERLRHQDVPYYSDLVRLSTEVVRDEWLGGGAELEGGPHWAALDPGIYRIRVEAPEGGQGSATVSFRASALIPASPG